VRTWLDQNPNEVITLLLVNYDAVSAIEIEAEYSKADLAHYGWVPPNITAAPPPSNLIKKTWPTLGEIIDKGERLVTFINPLTPDINNAPYLLNEFDFLWENAYDITTASNFSCTPDRPSNTTTMSEARESGKLCLMNHFLYWRQAFGIQTPDRRELANTNSWRGTGGLGKHLKKCANEYRRQPTFLLVDFFNVGPAIQAVDIFNKVQNAAGRKNVTTEILDNGLPSRKPSEAKRNSAFSTTALVIVVAGSMGVF
jgi:hypothetical protein